MATPSPKVATVDDLHALDDSDRVELVEGVLIEKAAPSMQHSTAQFELSAALGPFSRRGWWLGTAAHVQYDPKVIYCHDVVGWRRERVPDRPTEWPVHLRPDWVCEIVSPKHERRDVVEKLAVLHRAEVPHYWLIKPEEKLLLVQRWSAAGYTIVATATSGQKLRAEPVDAIELDVGLLFGEE